MAHLKEVVDRINLIASTQQITKAMKMVSASKLHKVQKLLLPLREYTMAYIALLHAALQNLDKIKLSHPLTKKITDQPKRLLLVVITSDLGLCGSFNKNVLKKAYQYIQITKQKEASIEVLVIGKKAYRFFKKAHIPIIDNYINLLEHTDFTSCYELTTYCIEAFQKEHYTEILLVYTAFKSAARQEVTILPFLPYTTDNGTQPVIKPLHYIYEPSQQLLIEKLIPEILQNTLMGILVESSASEHAMRMITMSQATDNADELLKILRISYNRRRQTLITNALAEITSSAEALTES